MKLVNKIPDLILFAAGIAFQIFIGTYAIFILAGCNTGPTDDPEFIGDWLSTSTEYLPEIDQQVTAFLNLKIDKGGKYFVDGTAQFSEPDTLLTIYTESGDWRASKDSITFFPLSCAALSSEGEMELEVCDPPRQTIALNIHGNIWTVAEKNGTITNYIKQ